MPLPHSRTRAPVPSMVRPSPPNSISSFPLAAAASSPITIVVVVCHDEHYSLQCSSLTSIAALRFYRSGDAVTSSSITSSVTAATNDGDTGKEAGPGSAVSIGSRSSGKGLASGLRERASEVGVHRLTGDSEIDDIDDKPSTPKYVSRRRRANSGDSAEGGEASPKVYISHKARRRSSAAAAATASEGRRGSTGGRRGSGSVSGAGSPLTVPGRDEEQGLGNGAGGGSNSPTRRSSGVSGIFEGFNFGRRRSSAARSYAVAGDGEDGASNSSSRKGSAASGIFDNFSIGFGRKSSTASSAARGSFASSAGDGDDDGDDGLDLDGDNDDKKTGLSSGSHKHPRRKNGSRKDSLITFATGALQMRLGKKTANEFTIEVRSSLATFLTHHGCLPVIVAISAFSVLCLLLIRRRFMVLKSHSLLNLSCSRQLLAMALISRNCFGCNRPIFTLRPSCS